MFVRLRRSDLPDFLGITNHMGQICQYPADVPSKCDCPGYQPFDYWLPDSEQPRKIGEYEPDVLADGDG